LLLAPFLLLLWPGVNGLDPSRCLSFIEQGGWSLYWQDCRGMMLGSNMETPIVKKARVVRPPRITDIAVPIRLHIYGFLNKDDVHLPYHYGGKMYGKVRHLFAKFDPFMIETAFASTLGDLELLQYLQGMPENPWQFHKCDTEDKRKLFYILNALTLGYGNYKSFQWARRSKFPWNEWTFEVAMRKALDLQILQWLHKKGCPLSEDTFAIAASHRDLNVLQWLREVQCPWCEWTFACAVRARRDWEVLIWLKTNGCPWDHESLHYAMKNNGNLLLIQYLLAEKCPSTNLTGYIAIETGNVAILKLLGDAGYSFQTEEDFQLAVEDKPLHFLQVLHSVNCPLSEFCFTVAVERGDMEILRWLRSVGCPWDGTTFKTAIHGGDIEIIRWLYEEKCPPSNEGAFTALMEKYLQLAE
jgi:hypothetical protein